MTLLSMPPARSTSPGRRLLSPLLGLVVVVGILVSFNTGTALAQQNDQAEESGPDLPALSVTSVDATGSSPVVVLFGADPATTTGQVSASSSAGEVTVQTVEDSSQAGWPVEVVFVVDTDNRTIATGYDSAALQAVDEFMAELPADTKVGLISAGSSAAAEIPLTTDRDRVRTAVARLAADRGSALLDGVSLAGQMFVQASSADASEVAAVADETVRTIVVLTDGADTASEKSVAAAGSSVLQAGAQVLVLTPGEVSKLSTLVDQTTGSVLQVGSVAEVGVAAETARELASHRLLVNLRPDIETDSRFNVELAIADRTTSFSYPAGLISRNALQLEPVVETEPGPLSFLGQPIFMYISIGLAFLGVTLAVWVLGAMFIRGESSLDRMLARYADGDNLAEEEVQEMLVETALLQRAVELTETFAERRGFLGRVEEKLERAAVPIRPGEALFFLAGFVLVAAALVTAASGTVVVGIVVGMIAAGIGAVSLNFLARRRLSKFEAQLPDTLQMLAGTLRAGYSLPQGIDAVSKEIDDPMGVELRRAMTEAQLGREIDDALGSVAERLDSPDFAWAVMALGIQREVGGNLNELLMTVAETMVQRDRLKREVAALTAEGRVSAIILSLMPPGLGVVLYVMNPEYVGILFSRTLGLALIALATVSALIGLLWMRKVMTIDA